jgi:hypothetical protein
VPQTAAGAAESIEGAGHSVAQMHRDRLVWPVQQRRAASGERGCCERTMRSAGEEKGAGSGRIEASRGEQRRAHAASRSSCCSVRLLRGRRCGYGNHVSQSPVVLPWRRGHGCAITYRQRLSDSGASTRATWDGEAGAWMGTIAAVVEGGGQKKRAINAPGRPGVLRLLDWPMGDSLGQQPEPKPQDPPSLVWAGVQCAPACAALARTWAWQLVERRGRPCQRCLAVGTRHRLPCSLLLSLLGCRLAVRPRSDMPCSRSHTTAVVAGSLKQDHGQSGAQP